jgi:hypothetical protein
MADYYNVTTPLGQRRWDNEQQVREHIAEYMKVQGASVNEISVIYVPDTSSPTVNPQSRSPGDFWESPA